MKGSARQIKTGARPTGSVEGLNLEAVQARFSSTDPGAVADAGIAYCAAARNLAEAEDEFARAVKYLTDHWQGDAADSALQELRKLEANARELGARSRQTGDALQRYGQILAKYQAVTLDPGFIRTKSDDRYAQRLMARLNTRTAEAYDALPDDVGLTDANISPASATGPSSAGGDAGGASGGGSSALSDSAGHGHGGAGTDGSGARHGSGDDAVGGGTDLAGLSGGGPSVAGTGPGPNALSIGGSGAVPGTAAVPGAAGSPVAGPAGFIGPAVGPGRGYGGARGGGSGRPGVIGAGGMVGGAGAGESEDEERERTFWLAEDRDTWGRDDEVVPAIVGREDHRPSPSGDGPDNVEVIDLDDEREPLIEDLDLEVSEVVSSEDVEIVGLEAEDGDAGKMNEPAYDEFDEFLDDVLGDDDLGDRRT